MQNGLQEDNWKLWQILIEDWCCPCRSRLCGLCEPQLAFPYLDKSPWRLRNPALLLSTVISSWLSSTQQHWEGSLRFSLLLILQLLSYHRHWKLIYSSRVSNHSTAWMDRMKIICSLNRKKVYTPQTKWVSGMLWISRLCLGWLLPFHQPGGSGLWTER